MEASSCVEVGAAAGNAQAANREPIVKISPPVRNKRFGTPNFETNGKTPPPEPIAKCPRRTIAYRLFE
jgi:hypothetical protein